MGELTSIPAEHRAIYHEALRAGLAEAERRGLELDALPFAAFHRALYRPMLDLAAAQAVRDAADNMQHRIVADWDPRFRQGAQWAADTLRAIADCQRNEAGLPPAPTPEHVRYRGPLRWDVCAACREPWPCPSSGADRG